MIHAFGPTSKEPHSRCSPCGLPHSRKSISWLVTRGPKTTEEHQQINHLFALTRCFRSFPIQNSAKCQKGTDTPSRSLSPASLENKATCFYPCSSLTLLFKMNLSKACCFSTSPIRFLLWSCRKQGAPGLILRRVEPPAGPFPLNSTHTFKGNQHSVNLGIAKLKLWRTSLAQSSNRGLTNKINTLCKNEIPQQKQPSILRTPHTTGFY